MPRNTSLRLNFIVPIVIFENSYPIIMNEDIMIMSIDLKIICGIAIYTLKSFKRRDTVRANKKGADLIKLILPLLLVL